MSGDQNSIRRLARPAAYGLIFDDQRLLLCRIAKSVVGSAGKWTLPGGGLEFGERPEDGLVREVFEETGLHVTVGQLASVESCVIDQPGVQFHSIQILYHAAWDGGTLTYEVDGTTDQCRWFSKSQARALPLVRLGQHGVNLAWS